jgi:hypothetical protein
MKAGEFYQVASRTGRAFHHVGGRQAKTGYEEENNTLPGHMPGNRQYPSENGMAPPHGAAQADLMATKPSEPNIPA